MGEWGTHVLELSSAAPHPQSAHLQEAGIRIRAGLNAMGQECTEGWLTRHQCPPKRWPRSDDHRVSDYTRVSGCKYTAQITQAGLHMGDFFSCPGRWLLASCLPLSSPSLPHSPFSLNLTIVISSSPPGVSSSTVGQTVVPQRYPRGSWQCCLSQGNRNDEDLTKAWVI